MRVTEQKGQPNPLHLLNRYRLELFHAHCSLIDQLFLRHWEKSLASRHTSSGIQSNWNCIIIDDRPSTQTRICILNTLLMTKLLASITIYAPESRVKEFAELIGTLSSFVSIKDLGSFGITDSLGWGKYNQLLKSGGFWKSIREERVLIFQPDALLIQPLNLDELDFDYAGAPWNKGRITSTEFPRYDHEMNCTGKAWISQGLCQTVPDETRNGNGGLSIRSPKLMQRICEDHASKSPQEEAEDIFFARHIQSDAYKAHLPSQAILDRLFNESSYSDSSGFHGSWYYLDASEQARLYEKHTKHVIGLLMALT